MGGVDSILSAKDHYTVLGTTRKAERAQLCRAYVETAVKVHPSVHPHPSAARAFLRATVAWTELRCEEKRQRYDADLQKGVIVLVLDSQLGSMEEAQATFSQAWNECLCGEVGSNMTEFASVLSRAQQLVHTEGGEAAEAERPLKAAAGGLAFSVGLWAAGAAASAGGFGTIGSLARRAALVQGASQVAIGGMAAYQRPEVKEAIDSGVAAAAEQGRACASGARTAVRGCAAKVASSCESPFALGALWEQLPSCLPRPKQGGQRQPQGAEEEASSSDSDGGSSDERPLKKRDAVYIHGLRAATDLNGKNGVITGFDRRSGRYMVRLLPAGADAGGPEGADASKEVKLIKKDNLIRSRNTAPATPEYFI